jgi:hypothetical protein
MVGVKAYRYERNGLERVARAIAPPVAGRARWPGLIVLAVSIGIFCRAESLHGSETAAHNLAARSTEMNRELACVVAAMAMAGGAMAQDAVQWRVQEGGNGHWYRVIHQARLWSDAKLAAEGIGGYLATTTTAAELLAIRPLLSAGGGTRDFFLGAHRQSNSTPWLWVTGEPFSFMAWEPGAPDNGPESLCLEVIGRPLVGGSNNPGFGLWNDETEYAAGGGQWYVVEWDADCNSDGIVDFGQILDGSLTDANSNNIPDCCEAGTPCAIAAKQWRVEDGGNGHWYGVKRVQPSVNPEAFFAIADQLGGHAATISSAGENGFCGQFVVPYDGMLVGLRKLSGTNQVGWVTGEPVAYVNWNTGEGTNLGERYAMLIATNAKWQDTDLTPRQWLLIEFDADCNSDGLVDFGQIRDGSLADANANNIPDCCEAGQSCAPCPADIVQDNAVNGVDLAAVINAWGTDGGKLPRSDVDGNGIVDGADLAQVLGAWGPCN